MEIKNRVAWITGGASGIGAATVKRIINLGGKVMITDINVEKGERVAAEMGENCIFVKADSTIFEELRDAGQILIDKWGRIDIVVNSAGRGGVGDFYIKKPPTAEQREIFDYIVKLNLYGSYDVARIAMHEMTHNEPNEHGERGVVIFIASMASDKIWMPFTKGTDHMQMNYGPSKAAVLALNRDMAVAGAPYGIRVNTIQPGYIKTPLTDVPEAKYIWPPMQLFPKDGGQADDIARVCQELIENYFINRTSVRVDAGIVG